MGILFIFAGNYQQALDYARPLGLVTRKDFIFIDGRYRLQGYRDCEYVLVGTYHERPDYYKIMEMLRALGFTERST